MEPKVEPTVRIAEIRGRLWKAVSGPWESMETTGAFGKAIIDVFQSSSGNTVCEIANTISAARKVSPDTIDATATFITNAPEDIEYLLNHIAKLEGKQ
jgi:hypothetical protein